MTGRLSHSSKDDEMTDSGRTTNFTGTDRFEVIRQLGAGGMGVVYEVLDRQRDARVALKFLPQAAPEALFAFKQEFRTLADVSHLNLVGLYELFSEGEQWFFTMELVDGVDLRTFILGETAVSDQKSNPDELTALVSRGSHDTDWNGEQTGPAHLLRTGQAPPARPSSSPILDEGFFVRLRSTLRQLAIGLREIHSHGLVHRDIKPPNVLVRKDGRVVVLDFGLASGQHVAEVESGRIVGTVAYMSPEQAEGRQLSSATDWYSVGAILYQVLTGQCPFDGHTTRMLLAKRTRDPDPPQKLNPNVPDELNKLTMSLLSRDPLARPSAADILRWLGVAEDADSGTPAERDIADAASHFVGRKEQLDQMNRDFEVVRGGGTAVVFVRGESGAGKTALVQRFLEELPGEQEAVVLTGRCYEQESVPFKAFDSLIDMLTRHLEKLPQAELTGLLPRDVAALARIFPVVQRIPAIAQAPSRAAVVPDQVELRRRGFAALREMLARLGDRHPLILLIDDLQWGDVDSANLFNELLQAPDPPVMLVLGTFRAEDEQRSECLRLLAAASEVDRQKSSDRSRTRESSEPEVSRLQLPVTRRVISLSPLTHDESLELAIDLLHRHDPAALAEAEQIVRESNGSPYFLSELAHDVRDGIHQSSPSTSLTDAEVGAPVSLRIRLDDALWRRIERLPENARSVLEVLSVASRPLRLVDALKVAHVSDSHAALARLRNERLVRATGVGAAELLAPYHDRIRETFVTRLSAETLRSRHQTLATTLAAGGGADAQTLAIHYEGAGDRESAGRHYAAAADEAGRALAFEQAANLYRKSLEQRPSSGTERCALLVRLADALANSGRGIEAAEQYLAASALAGSDEALMLQSKAGFNFCAAGDIDSGRDALAGVLSRLGMSLPKTRVRALLSLVFNRVRLVVRGIKFRERPDTELTADERMRLDVTWQVATGLFVIDTIRGTDFATRNTLLALKTGEPYRIARSLAWEATQTSMEGVKTQKATAKMLATADELAQRLNHPYALAMALMGRGISEFYFGQWRASTETCDRATAALTERCTGVAWELDMSNAFAYWALFWSGDFAEIQRRYPRLMADAQQRGDRLAVANYTTFAGPFAFLSQDDPEALATALAGAMGDWSKQDFHVQHFTALSAQTYLEQYRGRASGAWEHMLTQWPSLRGSFVLMVEIVRIYMHHLRAASAIAAASTLRAAGDRTAKISGGGRSWSITDLESEAAAWAKKLERERAAYARPMAAMIRAALSHSGGRKNEAIERLRFAATKLRELKAGMFAAAAQYQLGRLLGDDEGRQQLAEAEQLIRHQNVLRPDRIANLLAPGFE